MTPVRVGALFIAAICAFIVFYVRVNKDKFSKSATYEVSAIFDDASGLAGKTRVQIAGIDVGRIDKITLEGHYARVHLLIRQDIDLYRNAGIKKVSESLLGDFKLDISPGTASDAPSLKSLPVEERVISSVQSRSDLALLQGKLNTISDNVNAITLSMREIFAGKEGQGALKSILLSVDKTTQSVNQIAENLATLVSANDQHVSGIISNVETLSQKLNKIADSVSGIIGTNEEDVKKSVHSLKDTMSQLNSAIQNLASVSQKIDQGQGTVGKLINDPSLHDKVADVVDDTSGLIKKITGFQTEVDLRTEYHIPFMPDPNNPLIDPSGHLKNYLSFRLKPKPDKYYIFELVTDPRGSYNRVVTASSRINGGEFQGDKQESPKRYDDTTTVTYGKLKLSLLFAKRFYFATLRFGIIEDTGGVGFNLHALNDRFELKTDIFNFGARDYLGNPLLFKIKSMISFEPVRHFYLHAGVEDPLNWKKGLMTFSVGGGLKFNDDDLKYLLGTMGSAIRN